VNPDLQGNVIERVMCFKEEELAVVSLTENGKELNQDLQLVLKISKGLGKEPHLDELRKNFVCECLKGSDSGNPNTRYFAALLHLRNLGFFSASRQPCVWKKTFSGKSSVRVRKF
jgi:hypothetical protein